MHDEHGTYPSKRRAWAWLGAYMLSTGALYAVATRLPPGAAWAVPVTGLDAAIPFVPRMAPLYLSYFLLLPALIVIGTKRAWFLPAFFAACLVSGLALVWHLAVPTAIPPRPAADASSLLGWIQWADSRLGALPSLHIGLPVALTCVLAASATRWALAYAAWSLVLIVAVLTTKQHVVWDVAGGGVLGIVAGGAAIACRRARADFRTLSALGLEWLAIALLIVVALRVDAGWVYAAVIVLIATRQHALLMLYHEAVHGLVARDRHANDLIINALVGVPHALPVEIYRPLHLEHHRCLGTDRDPERRFLYADQAWKYQPLTARRLLHQLAGDLLVVNGARTIAAWRRSGGTMRFMNATLAVAALWLSALALSAWAFPRATAIVAVLWLTPLFTLTNMLQKIRSFAEHSGGPDATPGWPHWTYSWRPGWLGRLTLWPYHINLHREHHTTPSLPWHALARRADPQAARLPGRSLLGLLWNRVV